MVRKDVWEVRENEKTCAIDIDGVLSRYPDGWLTFASAKLGKTFDDIFVMKNTVPYQQYRDLKHLYRISGVKEHLATLPNASSLTLELKRLGYTIILLSKRPVDEYPVLFNQTVNWLSKNNIFYDGIIFDENKHTKIINDIPHLKFMIEDHRYIANLVAKFGYRVFLVNTKYNEGEVLKNVIRINDLMEIFKWIK